MAPLYNLKATNASNFNTFIVDIFSNIYYIGNVRYIYKYDNNGVLSTIYYSTTTKPSYLATDLTGNIYFTCSLTRSVYKINITTLISTKIAGNGSRNNITNGPALSSSFNTLSSIQVDSLQNVYVLSLGSTNQIGKISNNNISIILDNGMQKPTWISLDYNAQNIYILDQNYVNYIWIKKFNMDSLILSTLYTFNTTQINFVNIGLDDVGNIYFGNSVNYTVNLIETNGNISIIAGNGIQGTPNFIGYSTESSIQLPTIIQLSNYRDNIIYFVSVSITELYPEVYNLYYLKYVIFCFLEDTKILTNKGYLPIQSLRKGDLIQTLKHGYVPIDIIGYSKMDHVASNERIKDQLYKCTSENFPEVFEDLIITGCHSILVDNSTSVVNEEQIEIVKEINGGIFLTDDMLRLPACVDKRTIVYEKAGKYNVYHIALEHDDYYMNYGIYANGLLVESISKRIITEFSRPTFKILN